MLRQCRKAQSTLEYAIMLVIIMAAFLAVGNYFKRGIQGRWKEAVDEMGDQYDPRTAVSMGNSAITHRLDSVTETTIYAVEEQGGQRTNRIDVVESSETKTGKMSVGAY